MGTCSPASLGVDLEWSVDHSQVWKEGLERWINSQKRAVTERGKLPGQQGASRLFLLSWLVRLQLETNSPRDSSTPSALFFVWLPQTRNKKSGRWLSRYRKTPLFCLIPQSSSQFLYPSSLSFATFLPLSSLCWISLLYSALEELYACHAGPTKSKGRGENRSDRLQRKTKKRLWSWGIHSRSAVNQPHFLLRGTPLPVSLESCRICCHTLFLQTAPTMY